MSTQPEHLRALTGLRFVAAFAVVAHHSSRQFSIEVPRWPLGSFAVSFFFVLSGFVLAFAYFGRLKSTSDIARFYVTRWARIWPLHFVCGCLTIILLAGSSFFKFDPNAWGKCLVNFTLLQSWVPNYEWAFSINGVSWSISDEAFFYLMFPVFLIGGWTRFRGKYLTYSLGLIAALAIIQVSQRLNWLGNDFNYTTLVHLNPAIRLFEFATGVGLGIWFKEKSSLTNHKRKFWHDGLRELFAVGCLACTAYVDLEKSLHHFVSESILLGPVVSNWAHFSGFAFVFAIVIWVFATSRGFVARLLSTRWMVYLGEISFSLYMVHQIVIRFMLMRYAGTYKPDPWSAFIAITAVSILASAILHRFVEMPCKDAILKAYDRRWWQALQTLQGSWQKSLRQPAYLLMPIGICLIFFQLDSVVKNQHIHSVQSVLASSILPVERVDFGSEATLLGVTCDVRDNGVLLKTVWRAGSMTSRRRFIHVCDASGKILRHAAQSRNNMGAHKAGELWVDEVLLPFEGLQDAQKLGIGFFSKELGMAKPDTGPRSLSNNRLDIPLPVEQVRMAAARNDTSTKTR